MIETAQRGDFDHLARQLGRMMDELGQGNFTEFCPTEHWRPAMNVYRLADRIEVCVDLAGVDRERIDLRVEPGKLTIRGVRHAPEPPRNGEQSLHILGMEINHGPFCRTLSLPRMVDAGRVTAEQRNGLLWIHLPLRQEG